MDQAGLKRFEQAIGTIKSLWGQVFFSDNLITVDRCMSFTTDPEFMTAFKKNVTHPQDDSIIWRLHTVTWAARHCANLPGDFVECGVFEGFTSAVVIDYLNFDRLDKRFFLYDTYEGIPNSSATSSPSKAGAFSYKGLYEKVCQRFASHPGVQVVKGRVPESFAQACPDQIAFMHIDMNSAQAEIDALNTLWERMTPGGILILDDFGWFGYRSQTVAEIDFMKAREHTVMELPTGQGMVIKH